MLKAGCSFDHDAGAQGEDPPKQVVSLGCGMDTRAWRLDLPPGQLPGLLHGLHVLLGGGC